MTRRQHRQTLVLLGLIAVCVLAGLVYLLVLRDDDGPAQVGDIGKIAPPTHSDRVLKVDTEETRRGLVYIDAGTGTLKDGTKWQWRAARPGDTETINLPDREIPLNRDPAGIGGTLTITAPKPTTDPERLSALVRDIIDDSRLQLIADERIPDTFSVKASKVVALSADVRDRTLTLRGIFPAKACKDAKANTPLAGSCRGSRTTP